MRVVSLLVALSMGALLGGCATRIESMGGTVRDPVVVLDGQAKGDYHLVDNKGRRLATALTQGRQLLFTLPVTQEATACWQVVDKDGKALTFVQNKDQHRFHGDQHLQRQTAHAEVRHLRTQLAYADAFIAEDEARRTRALNALQLMPEVFDGTGCRQPDMGQAPRFACAPDQATGYALAYCGAKLLGCEAAESLLGAAFNSNLCDALVTLASQGPDTGVGNVLDGADQVASFLFGRFSGVRSLTFGLRLAECHDTAERLCRANHAGWVNQAITPFKTCQAYISQHNQAHDAARAKIQQAQARQTALNQAIQRYQVVSQSRGHYTLGCTRANEADARPTTYAMDVPDQAQPSVSFFNDSASMVRLAVATYDKTLQDWVVSGWEILEPGNVSSPSTSAVERVYYHAQSLDGSSTWSGEGADAVSLKVMSHHAPFVYKSKEGLSSSTARSVGFRLKGLTPGHTMMTLTATSPEPRYMIGVTGEPAPGKGLLLTSVVSSSPAEQAGLRAGDTLLAVGKTPVRSIRDLRVAVETARGQPLPFTVISQGAQRAIQIAARASYPDAP